MKYAVSRMKMPPVREYASSLLLFRCPKILKLKVPEAPTLTQNSGGAVGMPISYFSCKPNAIS